MNSSTASPLLFLGAPGLIGNQVIPVLIEAGFSVLAGSRRGLSVGGALGVGVDMRDPASPARAMQGMAAVGLVIPDVSDMESLGLNAVAAAKSAGVRRLLWFSSFGAKPDNQARFSRRHPVIDEAVCASEIPYNILRPNFLCRTSALFMGRQSGQQARFFCRSAMRGSATSIYAIWLRPPWLR
jgi:uncharacterized protein YbjT (DUF2867 family)